MGAVYLDWKSMIEKVVWRYFPESYKKCKGLDVYQLQELLGSGESGPYIEANASCFAKYLSTIYAVYLNKAVFCINTIHSEDKQSAARVLHRMLCEVIDQCRYALLNLFRSNPDRRIKLYAEDVDSFTRVREEILAEDGLSNEEMELRRKERMAVLYSVRPILKTRISCEMGLFLDEKYSDILPVGAHVCFDDIFIYLAVCYYCDGGDFMDKSSALIAALTAMAFLIARNNNGMIRYEFKEDTFFMLTNSKELNPLYCQKATDILSNFLIWSGAEEFFCKCEDFEQRKLRFNQLLNCDFFIIMKFIRSFVGSEEYDFTKVCNDIYEVPNNFSLLSFIAFLDDIECRILIYSNLLGRYGGLFNQAEVCRRLNESFFVLKDIYYILAARDLSSRAYSVSELLKWPDRLGRSSGCFFYNIDVNLCKAAENYMRTFVALCSLSRDTNLRHMYHYTTRFKYNEFYIAHSRNSSKGFYSCRYRDPQLTYSLAHKQLLFIQDRNRYNDDRADYIGDKCQLDSIARYSFSLFFIRGNFKASPSSRQDKNELESFRTGYQELVRIFVRDPLELGMVGNVWPSPRSYAYLSFALWIEAILDNSRAW